MKKSHLPATHLVSARQACDRVGISAATLYAYVSRGLVRRYEDPLDARRSLYDRRDVEALAARKKRPRSRQDIARSTIDWGEPILQTGICRIEDGQLFYRRESALTLAQSRSVEEVAALLTGIPAHRFADSGKSGCMPLAKKPLDRMLMALAQATCDPPGREGPARMARLVRQLVQAGAGTRAGAGEPVHLHVARGLGAGAKAADAVRRALILCADHELNPSTYAARIAASTGASGASAMLAAIATFNGPEHGLMPDVCAAWMDASAGGIPRLAPDDVPPGFGHRLYPDGDDRAKALLSVVRVPETWKPTVKAVRQATGQQPNVTLALACLQRSYGLCHGAATALFAIGRTIGWAAHIMEQRKSGGRIRPRAFSRA